MRRTQVEKSLSLLHDLLGESSAASAAIHVMRDLVSGPESSEPSACYCIDRVTLAVREALQAQHRKTWDLCHVEAEPSQAVVDAALCRDEVGECQACGAHVHGDGAVFCLPCRDQYDDASDSTAFNGEG